MIALIEALHGPERTVDDCSVANGDVVANAHVCSCFAMNNRIVLYVRPRTDSDGPILSPQYGTKLSRCRHADAHEHQSMQYTGKVIGSSGYGTIQSAIDGYIDRYKYVDQ